MILLPPIYNDTQPQRGVLVNPGHPLGGVLVAGWVMGEYPREIITGARMSDSATGPTFTQTVTGDGQNFAEGAVGFAAGTYSRLDNLLAGFSVVCASTPPGGAPSWLIYRDSSNAWQIGVTGTSTMRMQKKDVADFDVAAGLVAGQRYTLGWVHQDSTNWRAYVDGRQVGSSSSASLGTLGANTGSTQIGDRTGMGNQWDGKLEYLYVFGVSLGPQEMELLHRDPYALLRPQTSGLRWAIKAVGNAAVTGTATAAITEADVVAGGKTIVITLTGDTWVADGATFNAQRQAIIDGLDAASSPAGGWNAEVRDKAPVTDVVRTSDTVVTITLSAQAGYNITQTETITVTVPASAVTNNELITATPTFTVAPVIAGPGIVIGSSTAFVGEGAIGAPDAAAVSSFHPMMIRWGGIPHMRLGRPPFGRSW